MNSSQEKTDGASALSIPPTAAPPTITFSTITTTTSTCTFPTITSVSSTWSFGTIPSTTEKNPVNITPSTATQITNTQPSQYYLPPGYFTQPNMEWNYQNQNVPLTNNIYRPTTAPKWEHVITDAEIIDKVRKWNLKFDGSQDPLSFVERVNELAECYQIPKDRLIKTLPELLCKSALMWYGNNKENWRTWLNFEEDFKAFFLPPRYELKLSDDVRGRLQKPGEKAKDYITSIQSMMRWVKGLTTGDKLNRIYENMLPDYKLYIRPRDFRNLAELEKLTEEYEMIKDEERKVRIKTQEHKEPRRTQPTAFSVQTENKYEKKETHREILPARTSNTNSKNQQQQQTYSQENCCWKCGKTGHTRFVCRNPAKIFCFRCGKEGVISRNCECSHRPITRRNTYKKENSTQTETTSIMTLYNTNFYTQQLEKGATTLFNTNTVTNILSKRRKTLNNMKSGSRLFFMISKNMGVVRIKRRKDGQFVIKYKGVKEIRDKQEI